MTKRQQTKAIEHLHVHPKQNTSNMNVFAVARFDYSINTVTVSSITADSKQSKELAKYITMTWKYRIHKKGI